MRRPIERAHIRLNVGDESQLQRVGSGRANPATVAAVLMSVTAMGEPPMNSRYVSVGFRAACVSQRRRTEVRPVDLRLERLRLGEICLADVAAAEMGLEMHGRLSRAVLAGGGVRWARSRTLCGVRHATNRRTGVVDPPQQRPRVLSETRQSRARRGRGRRSESGVPSAP